MEIRVMTETERLKQQEQLGRRVCKPGRHLGVVVDRCVSCVKCSNHYDFPKKAPVIVHATWGHRIAEEALYKEALDSPRWKAMRAKRILATGSHCEHCRKHTDRPELHHDTYDRLGAELEEDVTLLCRDCHEKEHFNRLTRDAEGWRGFFERSLDTYEFNKSIRGKLVDLADGYDFARFLGRQHNKDDRYYREAKAVCDLWLS